MYGRSQDDLSVSPRTNTGFPPIMGLHGHGPPGGPAGYDGMGAGMNCGYYNGQGVRGGSLGDYYSSNGSSGGSARRGHRPLQHMHSRDDLDTLRPRKTRRTGAPYHADDDCHDAPVFFGTSPRRPGLDVDERLGGVAGEARGDGRARDADAGAGDNVIPYPAAVAVYAAPDEVPPAPPRRLVSRHNNTPSRPDRAGALNCQGGSVRGEGGVNGVGGAGVGGNGDCKGVQVAQLDANAMDTDSGGGAGTGGMSLRQGFNLAASGFYATVSPVAVGAARGTFPGGRRHQRHHSNGAPHQVPVGTGPPGDAYAGDNGQLRNAGWRPGEVSPEEASSMRGDSPASSRSGGGAANGAGAVGGLGLTAHAMSRMEQVAAVSCVWWLRRVCSLGVHQL